MRKESLTFLENLINTPSPSGFEAKGQKVWLDYVKPYADETFTDDYGNAYAVLNPAGKPKIMIAGHADEIGYMVHYINDAGFIYIVPIGGPDVALARGQRVHIHTRKGAVTGVTGSLAVHMQDRSESPKVPQIHDIFIDIGVKSKKEAEALVSIGDPITYVDRFEILRGDIAVARGCDNRIGTFAAADTLRVLSAKRKTLKACVVAVSHIQEENGLYGAHMSAYRIKPDAALVVDVGQATDIPLCSKVKHGDQCLGKGPILSVGSVNHPVVLAKLREVAAKRKIPYQLGVDSRYSGTDADAIFTSVGGIPSVSVGLPNRYMHTPVEMIHLGDLENIVSLMSEFALSLTEKTSFKTVIG